MMFQNSAESRELIRKYDSFLGTEKTFLFIAFFYLAKKVFCHCSSEMQLQ